MGNGGPFVIDLTYTHAKPSCTQVRAPRVACNPISQGCGMISGIQLLIWQGVEQFKMFFFKTGILADPRAFDENVDPACDRVMAAYYRQIQDGQSLL